MTSQGKASLEAIQRVLSPREAILGWIEASQGGAVPRVRMWAYLVRREGEVTWAPIHAPDATDFCRRLRDFRATLVPSRSALGVEDDPALAAEAARLGDECIGGIRESLKGLETLIVVPSSSMAGLPVEALRDREGTLIGERFVVSYAPSASVLTWLVARRAEKDAGEVALFVGDPPFRSEHVAAMASADAAVSMALDEATPDAVVLRDAMYADPEALGRLPRLVWSRREVESASSCFEKPEVLLGAHASESSLRSLSNDQALERFDVVHIATHALIDGDDPFNSALVLSQVAADDENATDDRMDGLLTGAEIAAGWKLNARLVTLSSCETAAGRVQRGEGTIGFTYPFLAAGARCMLLSLWRVDDEATALLMQRFYKSWHCNAENPAAGARAPAMTKAAALRDAKLWLRTLEDDQGRRRFEHPYYWSGFVLVGDAG